MEEPIGRMRRINELLHEEIATLLRSRWSRETVAITLTKVECDPDLRHAHVYYSVLNDDKGPAVRFFRQEGGAVAKALTKVVVLKRHPQLHFLYDESLKNMANVDRILNTLDTPPAALPAIQKVSKAEIKRANKPLAEGADTPVKRRSTKARKPKRQDEPDEE